MIIIETTLIKNMMTMKIDDEVTSIHVGDVSM